MEFQLYGRVGYAVGSCHDDRSIAINEEFSVPDGPNAETMAIEKAREILRGVHKKYSHFTDYALAAGLRVIKEIWETHFEDDQPAIPAVPARKEKPPTPAHFAEKIIR